MKVSEVIEMLRKLPQDYDVMVAYDSMICVWYVDTARTFVAHDNPIEGEPHRVYLCAMSDDSVEYHCNEYGGVMA